LKAQTKPRDFFEPAITHQIIDTILAVDTAWSTAKTADFSAIATIKVCQFNGKPAAIVTGCPFGRWKLSELAIRVVEACHETQPTKTVIERSGSWEALRDEISKQALLRGYILPPIYWRNCGGGAGFKVQKALKIKELERMIADGTLWFTQFPGVDQAHAQFISFDGVTNSRVRFNDVPDAIATGITSYFPGLQQTKHNEDFKAQEEKQQEALARRLKYEMIFGSGNPSSAPTIEPTPDRNQRGGWGIPRSLAVPGVPSPRKQVGFGSIMPKKQQ
jgi:hypothetical protein